MNYLYCRYWIQNSGISAIKFVIFPLRDFFFSFFQFFLIQFSLEKRTGMVQPFINVRNQTEDQLRSLGLSRSQLTAGKTASMAANNFTAQFL